VNGGIFKSAGRLKRRQEQEAIDGEHVLKMIKEQSTTYT
jgi:hypothetical protein